MKKKIFLSLILILVFFQPHAWDEDVWSQSFKKISAIVPLIEENYYKEVEHEELAFSSIRGILLTLDPHSYFLNPKNLSTLREDYKGKYFGLGIMIQKHADLLKVISPLEGTPAYRLGIQSGDVISHIEGESTKPITSFQAMQKLRGKKGTKITITITREGLDEPMDITITRAEIPLYSVPYAFMLQDNIGYIFIRNFAENTTKEFREKMAMLEKLGMQKLILDFRGNGGGTFLQSLEITDEFLPKGDMIVSIRGRKKHYSREFRASKNDQYEHIPLIILISQGTASAPEIVSGAVQDHDRGLIIGQDSWGKGLVQTVFPLSKEAAVAITTARYYTPSGRSIQRDYTYLEDYRLKRDEPEEREVKYTDGGRKVLGQGGISPDYKVELSYKPLTYMLLLRGAVFSYGRKFAEKQTSLSRELMKDEIIDRSFEVNSRVFEDFQAHLEEVGISFKPEDFEESKDELKRELEREIFSSIWSIEEGMKVFRQSDPLIRKAIDVFPQAEKLIHK